MFRLHSSMPIRFLILTALVCTAALTGRRVLAQEGFEGWNLEPGLGQAHLVMVARVASISRLTIVEGAKTDVALREYRFQPVRKLKGIFQREQLSMTPADLGISAEDASAAPPLKEGEFRLLILAQRQGNSMGCVSAAPGATTFDERVPLLTGPDDPLVGVIETLIKVADSRSRRERAMLLVDRLVGADGLPAVPLLSSLKVRADWAAADERAYPALARLVQSPLPAVRGGALEVLRGMLASRVAPKDPRQLDGVAKALREILESKESVTSMRLDAVEALGDLIVLKTDIGWALELMTAQLTGAATYAERSAAASALARIGGPKAATAVLSALDGLPLDETTVRESLFARAAVKLDARGAEQILLARLKRSLAARQSLEAEIDGLGRLHSKDSLPILLAATDRPSLSAADRQSIAAALGRLADDRAVPVLAGWLRTEDYRLKELALAALENLDSQSAAREARSFLKSEPYLPYKLRLARLLARHGMADGYALATEHLADPGQTAPAVLVLAALDDPRTSKELSAILAAHPDRHWRAAALAGLVAIGDAAARKQLLEILASDRNPLSADAAEAVGLAAESELVTPLATLAQSRNKQIAMSSLVAIRRFLCGVRTSPRGLAAADINETDLESGEAASPSVEIPAATRAAIVKAATALVLDAYVDSDLRREAFTVARLLRGEQYAGLLSDLADQAELEGTPLLDQVIAEQRRSHAAAKRS